MTFAEWYYESGTARGYDMPRIAPAHSGPYRLAIMLQDPGGPLAGSGAQQSGEIGVTNNDATARFVRNCLEVLGIPQNEIVLINSLPGYGLENSASERRRGASFNTEVIKKSGVRVILIAGAISRDVAKHIDFGPVSVFHTHHPSTLGHNRRGSGEIGKLEWRSALRQAWSIVQP